MTTQRLTIERPGAFRRRRFVVPHRRRSRTLMLLKPFLMAVLLVGLPLAAASWVYTSPRFLLKQVQIGSTEHVSTEEVAAALSSLRGRHLLSLSLEDVEGWLTANPWVESAAIRKELPDKLVVQIVERIPVALLRRDGELFYVDSDGFVIGAYDLEGPVDLVLLSVAPGAVLEVAQALEMAASLERLAPEMSRGLSEIEVMGQGDYRIYTADLGFPILISAGDVAEQISKLVALLPEISRRFAVVEAVDLRFSRQIVIQPAGDPRSQEG
jgi:cell division protein FtsQ